MKRATTHANVDAQLDVTLNPDYWSELNPALSIESAPNIESLAKNEPGISSNRKKEFTRHGYFQTEPLLPGHYPTGSKWTVQTHYVLSREHLLMSSFSILQIH